VPVLMSVLSGGSIIHRAVRFPQRQLRILSSVFPANDCGPHPPGGGPQGTVHAL
jgi:hypothetical protein